MATAAGSRTRSTTSKSPTESGTRTSPCLALEPSNSVAKQVGVQRERDEEQGERYGDAADHRPDVGEVAELAVGKAGRQPHGLDGVGVAHEDGEDADGPSVQQRAERGDEGQAHDEGPHEDEQRVVRKQWGQQVGRTGDERHGAHGREHDRDGEAVLADEAFEARESVASGTSPRRSARQAPTTPHRPATVKTAPTTALTPGYHQYARSTSTSRRAITPTSAG